ncbi:dihydrolipoamide acetyltransferase family protein [bacterium]|nr:dihydrolipoamide acetyltransferase family protein [bacterium]
MPKMGESITEGTILEWRKEVGDSIELDEILLEIGTDKVDSEIPSAVSGTIVEILAEPNDVIEVGKVIARIDSSGKVLKKEENLNEKEDLEEKQKIQNSHAEYIENKVLPKSIEEAGIKKNKEDHKRFYTPVVLKVASQNNITFSDLEKIDGTGNNGRVTKKDILNYLNSLSDLNKLAPETKKSIEPSEFRPINSSRVEEMPKMRKLISSHMKESLETAAHVYLMTEVDMTKIVSFVSSNEESFALKEGFKLTYTPFIVDAVVKALIDYPEMNASLVDTKIHYHKNINIGLAVAIKNGLMVPSISSCEEKNFLGFCRSINQMASKARENKLLIDEIEGSTFSITNFGVFGISFGTPIINQPNTGILGVGAIKKQPVVIESDGIDAIGIRNIMMLSLGFDHRLIDGAGGSKFLNSIQLYLEDFNKELFGTF